MSKQEIVNAWKDPKLREAAGVATPAGERAGEAELKNASGGMSPWGNYFTISYECMGFSCNPYGY